MSPRSGRGHQRTRSVVENPAALRIGGLKIPEETRVWHTAASKNPKTNGQPVIEEEE
jgi:hypothetical protein